MTTACPSCGSPDLEQFYDQPAVPIHSCRLVQTEEDARVFPTRRLTLAVCHACGFITNVAYDTSVQDYRDDYEETQAFSPLFREFMTDLARRWVDAYDLRGKEILELGSGKGEFLVEMTRIAGSRGVGIDPGFVPERVSAEDAARVRFIKDYYSEAYADLEADAIVCRHTLEHIHRVGDFMRLVRGAADRRPGTVLLFELPDVLRVLREAAFWDMYYEHVSYFTPGSLARLFERSGFAVLGLELDYDDQYILIEGKLASEVPDAQPVDRESVDEVLEAVGAFRSEIDRVQTMWRERIAAVESTGGDVVVWGAGSKAVAFLTTIGRGTGIRTAVDINPHKHDTYLAGAGQHVESPEYLRQHAPALVIAMNPIYLPEIGASLSELGVDAELAAV
jgi:SAM-dependent methyltransferase